MFCLGLLKGNGKHQISRRLVRVLDIFPSNPRMMGSFAHAISGRVKLRSSTICKHYIDHMYSASEQRPGEDCLQLADSWFSTALQLLRGLLPVDDSFGRQSGHNLKTVLSWNTEEFPCWITHHWSASRLPRVSKGFQASRCFNWLDEGVLSQMDIIVGACTTVVAGVLQECAVTRRLTAPSAVYRRGIKLILMLFALINRRLSATINITTMAGRAIVRPFRWCCCTLEANDYESLYGSQYEDDVPQNNAFTARQDEQERQRQRGTAGEHE